MHSRCSESNIQFNFILITLVNVAVCGALLHPFTGDGRCQGGELRGPVRRRRENDILKVKYRN
jgi:hypothetical protein